MYTLNNYTPEDVVRHKGFDCTFHVFAEEVGENGTPHLQGCITFTKNCRFKTLQKFMPRCRLERPMVLEIARNYCMKETCFILDRRKPGERKDIHQLTADIMSGMPIKEAAWKHPTVYAKYPSGMKDLHAMAQEPRNFKPIVSWYYGSTGTGKSLSVVRAEPSLWISGEDIKFWNAYENQTATLFDDMRGDFCKFSYLLKILDYNEAVVNVKNGHRQLNSKRMYITSNRDPQGTYPNCGESMAQLIRRIDNIVEFTMHPVYPGEVVFNIVKGEFVMDESVRRDIRLANGINNK